MAAKTGTYTLIATSVLGSATNSVTLNSIPATYTDLVLVVNAALASSNASVLLRFNGDSATNYSGTRIIGNGTSATSDRTTNSTQVDIGYYNSGMCNSIVSIQDYANTTTYKTAIIRANTSDYVFGQVQMWRSTAAINSLNITNSSALNFNAGSTFKLYGIEAGNL